MNPRATYTTDDIKAEMVRIRAIYSALPFEEFLFVVSCDILDARESRERGGESLAGLPEGRIGGNQFVVPETVRERDLRRIYES